MWSHYLVFYFVNKLFSLGILNLDAELGRSDGTNNYICVNQGDYYTHCGTKKCNKAPISFGSKRFFFSEFAADLLIYACCVILITKWMDCTKVMGGGSFWPSNEYLCQFEVSAPSICNLSSLDLRINEAAATFKTGIRTYMFLSAYER